MAESSRDRKLIQARAGALVAAVLTGGGIFVSRGAHSWTPGDLSSVHVAEVKDCTDCHQPWRGPQPERCFACHTEWPEAKPYLEGIHRTMLAGPVDCWGCHREHAGEAVTLAFDHEATRGEVTQACTRCHEVPDDRLHAAAPLPCGRCHGTEAWRPHHFRHEDLQIDRRRDCAKCHETPSDQTHDLTSTACWQCHRTDAWTPAQFAHRALKPANGRRCSGCHPKPENRLHRLAPETCHLCHTDEGWRPASRSHRVLTRGGRVPCTNCHVKPKTRAHRYVSAACNSCHTTQAWRPASFSHRALDRRVAGNCVNCHRPPRDRRHPAGTRACNRCHSERSWTPAGFDHSRYFRLRGKHAARCATCHPGSRFTAYTCYGCHEHRPDKIASKHRKKRIADTRDCARCHGPRARHR